VSGADPLKVREVQRLARQLARLFNDRKRARKALAKAELEIRQVKRTIRDLLAEGEVAPEDRALCPSCERPIGTTATCVECQAVLAIWQEGKR